MEALSEVTGLGGMVEFAVLGTPQPAGSKRAFVNPKTNRAIVTDDNRKAKPWQAEIKAAAREALPENFELLRGPVWVTFYFHRERPKSHYGTGRNSWRVKDSAPPFPTTRPDALKLARAVEDALTGIVWADDSQIVVEHLVKVWGSPARVEIKIQDWTP